MKQPVFKQIFKQTILKKTVFTLFLLIFSVSNSAFLYAEDTFNSDSPLNITSESMLAKEKEGTIEFKGDVVVTREDSIIKADKITMFFIEKARGNGDKKEKKIDRIIAEGHVKYFSNERKAFAGKAVYTYDNEILVLTENSPKVITGENSVTGKKITLFQKDGRVIIEGSVNATINPGQEGEQKKE